MNDVSDERIEEFFERRHDLIAQHPKLLAAWRKRVHPDVVRDEDDLLSPIVQGAQMLLVKAADPETGRLPTDVRFAISAKGAEKLSSWSKLDRSVYALFRLEMRLLQGAFGDLMEIDLGQWLSTKAIEASRDSTATEARSVELEMRLLGAEGDEGGQIVRAIWRPCPSKERSIALSLPEDIERLHQEVRPEGARLRAETITPIGRGDDAATTLHRVESFGDASGSDGGRTADPSRIADGEEWFERVGAQLDRLASEHKVGARDGRRSPPRSRTSAPPSRLPSEACRMSPLLGRRRHPAAAEALGALCEAARVAPWRDPDARATALRMIVEFGLATSSTSMDLAILPAWHPLRLLERHAKAHAVAHLLREALQDERATSDGIEAEAAAHLQRSSAGICPRWPASGRRSTPPRRMWAATASSCRSSRRPGTRRPWR